MGFFGSYREGGADTHVALSFLSPFLHKFANREGKTAEANFAIKSFLFCYRRMKKNKKLFNNDNKHTSTETLQWIDRQRERNKKKKP